MNNFALISFTQVWVSNEVSRLRVMCQRDAMIIQVLAFPVPNRLDLSGDNGSISRYSRLITLLTHPWVVHVRWTTKHSYQWSMVNCKVPHSHCHTTQPCLCHLCRLLSHLNFPWILSASWTIKRSYHWSIPTRAKTTREEQKHRTTSRLWIRMQAPWRTQRV